MEVEKEGQEGREEDVEGVKAGKGKERCGMDG